jgi:hypothetical protein
MPDYVHVKKYGFKMFVNQIRLVLQHLLNLCPQEMSFLPI